MSPITHPDGERIIVPEMIHIPFLSGVSPLHAMVVGTLGVQLDGPSGKLRLTDILTAYLQALRQPMD